MIPAHTKGPWRAIGPQSGGMTERAPVVCGPDADYICQTFGTVGDMMTGWKQQAANAARIVACVNGCEGIADPSAIPEIVAALLAVVKWAMSEGLEEPCFKAARAALAKAEGRAS